MVIIKIIGQEDYKVLNNRSLVEYIFIKRLTLAYVKGTLCFLTHTHTLPCDFAL